MEAEINKIICESYMVGQSYIQKLKGCLPKLYVSFSETNLRQLNGNLQKLYGGFIVLRKLIFGN